MREEKGKDVRSGANCVERDIALCGARRPGVARDGRDVEHGKQVRDVREEDRFGEVEPRADPSRHHTGSVRGDTANERQEMGDGGGDAYLRP